MATSTNAYERLYSNMKERFTVVNGGNECSLGEYMLMKAGKKKDSTLPVSRATLRQPSVISSFFSYVNDKLMVREAPAKDKVIRAFPFRTTAAAVLSALLVCTFVISYGAASIKSITGSEGAVYTSYTEDDSETKDTEENYSVR